VKVIEIKGNGYRKLLFTDLGLPGNEEFSLFFWNNGESPAHDHSVDEITYVVSGTIREYRRRADGIIVSRAYEAGEQFDVPAGTQHVVKSKGAAITINFCKGKLQMNILKNFPLESFLAGVPRH